MGAFDRNFWEIFSGQLVSVAGGLLAGFLIVLYSDKLFFLPGILVLLPGFLEMRGNISGTFASRLSSGLFLGVIDKEKPSMHIILGNVLASIALALSVSLFLGLLASLFTFVAFGFFDLRVVVVSLLAGILANAFEIPLALWGTFFLFRKGHDPNNIIGPFITSSGDIVSVVALLVAVAIV